jgi:hypothetical protein
VVGYEVDARNRILVIHTEIHTTARDEVTDVRFAGVLGYHLRDNLAGILFDITEVPVRWLFENYADDLAWGSRYCWPWLEASPDHDHASYITSQGATVWAIGSSLGFSGFVVSKSMAIEAAEPGAAADAATPRR